MGSFGRSSFGRGSFGLRSLGRWQGGEGRVVVGHYNCNVDVTRVVNLTGPIIVSCKTSPPVLR